MRARGQEVRIDDTPEVLTKRLASYRSLTEPLIHYYSERRKLLTVDGMMTIEHVTREINRILAAIGAVVRKPPEQARKPTAAGAKKASGSASMRSGTAAKTAQKAAKTVGKAGKPASKAAKKPVRKAGAGSRTKAAKAPKKPAKKVTKRRAKA
jgi:adenylate kinase